MKAIICDPLVEEGCALFTIPIAAARIFRVDVIARDSEQIVSDMITA